MTDTEPLIRNLADTARWVAVYRAQESERPDAHFRDPFARRLAGERGEQIARALPFAKQNAWSFVTRTVLVDRFITEQIEEGTDVVINLAAGLDARPYRMALPAALPWVEVDLPEVLDYKEEILRGETPVCRLERVRLDLSDVAARQELFARLGRSARKALVVTEGLLVYLTAEEVGALAQDLGAPPGIQRWIIDVASPGLLKLMNKRMGPALKQAEAPLKFAPEEGPPFFERFGWEPLAVRSLLHTAAGLKRLPFFLRLMALLPEPKGPAGSRPWSAVCLLAKK